MAKYRLSYMGYDGYKSIDLEKLECLKEKKVTDIQIIDAFTTSFENLEELLTFLKRNEIIAKDVNKIVITVDKKENGETINKKIFRGEHLLFKEDKNFLNLSFIYKWIMTNLNNSELMIDICNNYIEKYQNAYNRITGSSYILGIFRSLKNLAINIKRKNPGNNINYNEIKEYENAIKEFINFEFYKIDKERTLEKGIIVRKKEKDGTFSKSYRNIHDFIVLLKTMELNLDKQFTDNYVIPNIDINIKEPKQDIDNREEYLTEEDIISSVQNTLHPKVWDEKFEELVPVERKKNQDDEYEPYRDGNDFHSRKSEEELEASLYEAGMSLLKTPKTGDLK